MATVTVGGGGSVGLPVVNQVLVTTLQDNSLLAGQISALALQTIANTTPANAVTVIGGTQPTTVPVLSNTVTAVLIENTSPTTMNNQAGAADETIFTSTGGLTFADYGTSDTIVAGGWQNYITFESISANGFFLGDGTNLITINSTVAGGTTTVVGTASSIDTVVGSTASGSGIYYLSALGANAFIDPGAHNATVVGTAGGTETVSVFGGTPFTGSLNVINGDGYFQGGTDAHGKTNIMGSSSLGSTTLIGGGAGDVLTSNGNGDRLIGGLGAETLQSAGSNGGVAFYASVGGTTTIYMHPSESSSYGSNSVVGGNPGLAGWTSGAESASVWDFVSGTDKLVLYSSVTGAGPATISAPSTSLVGGQSVSVTTVMTSNGSVFTFYGSTIQSSDIIQR